MYQETVSFKDTSYPGKSDTKDLQETLTFKDAIYSRTFSI